VEEAVKPTVLQHDENGQGEPIVLIPGGLTGWLSWIPHQERLADRYRASRVARIPREGRPIRARYEWAAPPRPCARASG
jgi:hypothetical protein